MFGTASVLALLLQAAVMPANVPANPDNETVCRRIEVTGSIARREKVCKTRGEWRRLSIAGNNAARAIVEHSAGRPPDMQ